MRKTTYLKAIGLVAALSLSPMAMADNDHDVEGRIESINQQARSFVVNGMTIHTTRDTDYDDDLNNFSDLKVGQRVEVDYFMRDGKRVAEEIELDD